MTTPHEQPQLNPFIPSDAAEILVLALDNWTPPANVAGKVVKFTYIAAQTVQEFIAKTLAAEKQEDDKE